MVVTLTLNILQRVKMMNLFDSYPGNKRDSRIDSKIVGKVQLTKEEIERCEFRVVQLDSVGQISYRWKPDADFESAIEFNNEETTRMIAVFEGWPGSTASELRSWLEPILVGLGI